MALAEWIVAQPNFSRTIVNRMWGHMFGRGIVDPVDDFRSTNPPTHPELLDELARDFAGNGYDLRRLLGLTPSPAPISFLPFPTPPTGRHGQLFAPGAPDLEPEILLDAISNVTGVPETFKNNWMGTAPRGTRAIHLRVRTSLPATFLDIYDRPTAPASPSARTTPA